MRYSRRTLNYTKRLVLSNLTHVMIMTDLVAMGIEIFLGFEVDKISKILIKASNTAEYIDLVIQNIEAPRTDDPII